VALELISFAVELKSVDSVPMMMSRSTAARITPLL
jgi:hypothetical protein